MLVWHFNKQECASKHRKILPEQLKKETACRESGFVSWYYKQHLNGFCCMSIMQFSEIFITGSRKISIRWSHRCSSDEDKGPNPTHSDHSPFRHPTLEQSFLKRPCWGQSQPYFLWFHKPRSLPFLSTFSSISPSSQEDRDCMQWSKAWWCVRATYSFRLLPLPSVALQITGEYNLRQSLPQSTPPIKWRKEKVI